MSYIVLFFTHSGAIKFDRKCKKSNIKCELMPVPRVLSSNCSVSAKIEYGENIGALVDDEVEKIFLLQNSEYKLIYSEE